jgi:hypothetical protein
MTKAKLDFCLLQLTLSYRKVFLRKNTVQVKASECAINTKKGRDKEKGNGRTKCMIHKKSAHDKIKHEGMNM